MPFLDEPKRLKEVFSLATPNHMLHKLYWEVSEFRKACLHQNEDSYSYAATGYIAFNCAVTALHCADWAWSAAESDTQQKLGSHLGFRIRGNSKSDVTAFSDALERQNRDFYICRQIANGSKHMRREDPSHSIEVSVECSPRTLVENRYIVDFVIRDGDEKMLALTIFERICEFWTEQYRDLGYIEDRFIR
jgi:hypothetical protein